MSRCCVCVFVLTSHQHSANLGDPHKRSSSDLHLACVRLMMVVLLCRRLGRVLIMMLEMLLVLVRVSVSLVMKLRIRGCIGGERLHLALGRVRSHLRARNG